MTVETPLSLVTKDSKKDVVAFKASAFVSDLNKSSINYELKRSTAVWDTALRRFRCPVGVTGGGQLTNRMGSNCGRGVVRRALRGAINAGRKLDDDLGKRRAAKPKQVAKEPKKAVRTAKRKPKAAKRVLANAASRAANALDVTGRQRVGPKVRERREVGKRRRQMANVVDRVADIFDVTGGRAPQPRRRAADALDRAADLFDVTGGRAPQPRRRAANALDRAADLFDVTGGRAPQPRRAAADALDRAADVIDVTGRQRRGRAIVRDIDVPNAPGRQRRIAATENQVRRTIRRTTPEDTIPDETPVPQSRRFRAGGLGTVGSETFRGMVGSDVLPRRTPKNDQEFAERVDLYAQRILADIGIYNFEVESHRNEMRGQMETLIRSLDETVEKVRNDPYELERNRERLLELRQAAQEARDLRLRQVQELTLRVADSESPEGAALLRAREIAAADAIHRHRIAEQVDVALGRLDQVEAESPLPEEEALPEVGLGRTPKFDPESGVVPHGRYEGHHLGYRMDGGVMVGRQVPIGTAGIENRAHAEKHLRRGGALDDVPDAFLKDAIVAVGQDRFDIKQIDVGINNLGANAWHEHTVELTDRETGRKYIMKDPKFFQSEFLGEMVMGDFGRLAGLGYPRVRVAGANVGRMGNLPILIEHIDQMAEGNWKMAGVALTAAQWNDLKKRYKRAVDTGDFSSLPYGLVSMMMMDVIFGNGDGAMNPGNYFLKMVNGRIDGVISIDNGAAAEVAHLRIGTILGILEQYRSDPQVAQFLRTLKDNWTPENIRKVLRGIAAKSPEGARPELQELEEYLLQLVEGIGSWDL